MSLNDEQSSRRFPRVLYETGIEPDPRFSLANERTFLAWVRTAIALIAAGVALEAFPLSLNPGLRLTASLALIGVGILACIQAWFGWFRTEKALRLNGLLPPPLIAAPLALMIFLVGILITLAVLLK